jgi:hypothetical protein
MLKTSINFIHTHWKSYVLPIKKKDADVNKYTYIIFSSLITLGLIGLILYYNNQKVCNYEFVTRKLDTSCSVISTFSSYFSVQSNKVLMMGKFEVLGELSDLNVAKCTKLSKCTNTYSTNSEFYNMITVSMIDNFAISYVTYTTGHYPNYFLNTEGYYNDNILNELKIVSEYWPSSSVNETLISMKESCNNNAKMFWAICVSYVGLDQIQYCEVCETLDEGTKILLIILGILQLFSAVRWISSLTTSNIVSFITRDVTKLKSEEPKLNGEFSVALLNNDD